VIVIKNRIAQWCFFLVPVFSLVVLPACWPAGSKKVEKQKGLVVINVLSKALYDDCHIKGSINVPFEKAEQYAQEKIDKLAQVVLYCSNFMCTSSSFVRKKLVSLGFKNVWVYEGGAAEWYQLGYPTEGPATMAYLTKKIKAPERQESYVMSAQVLKQRLMDAEKKNT